MISQRYERGATLITSNLPFDEWTSVFGSERLTGALLGKRSNNRFYTRLLFPARLTLLAMMRGVYGWAKIDGEAADLAETC